MTLFIAIFVFLFGIVFGSFLNVCIHRMPLEESVVRPGSHCPQCKTPIAWHDNIPLVSFILLKAKCRNCGAKISWRYFAVEFFLGLIWVLLWLKYGFSGTWVASLVLMSILFAVSIIDLEAGIIPDNFSLPGMAIGLILSTAYPELMRQQIWYQGLKESALGLLTGGGTLLLIGLLGNFIFRKESMGGGDIKLMGLLGAFLGFKKVLLVLLFAPIFSMPVALYVKLFKKGETIPFGPFLAIAGAWLFMYGDQVVDYFFLF